jgi:hypothetical protein
MGRFLVPFFTVSSVCYAVQPSSSPNGAIPIDCAALAYRVRNQNVDPNFQRALEKVDSLFYDPYHSNRPEGEIETIAGKIAAIVESGEIKAGAEVSGNTSDVPGVYTKLVPISAREVNPMELYGRWWKTKKQEDGLIDHLALGGTKLIIDKTILRVPNQDFTMSAHMNWGDHSPWDFETYVDYINSRTEHRIRGEVLIKHTVPLSFIRGAWVHRDHKPAYLRVLKSRNIHTINGKPVEDFFIVSEKLP